MRQALHIVIREADWPALETIAAQLVARGFQLDHQLDAIGVLAGSAAVEDIDALRAVPGVQGLELVRSDYEAS